MRGNNNTANSPENSLENSPGNSPGNSQVWYVDSCCYRHMIGEKFNFLSLTAAQGGSMAFENSKSRTIVGIGKIGESLSHSIDNVYLVDGLRHNLLSCLLYTSTLPTKRIV